MAGDHLGLGLTSGQLDFALNKLYNERTNKGLLVHYRLGEAQHEVYQCRCLADEFFEQVQQWAERHASRNGRVTDPRIVEDPLSPALTRLSQSLTQFAGTVADDSQRTDLAGAAAACSPWLRKSTAGSNRGCRMPSTGSNRDGRAATTAA